MSDRVRFAVSLNVAMGHEPMDSLNQSYIVWCEHSGICPILFSNAIANIGEYLTELNIEGLLLTGGNDITVGSQPTAGSSESPRRDQAESALLSWALEKDLPIFGICRGMQFINQFFGGALSLHIHNSVPGCCQHVARSHTIRILEKRISALLKTEYYTVNSFHNHGVVVDGVAPSLRPFAVAEGGGVVEGIFHPTKKVMAIQWHPERNGSTHEFDARLIAGFLNNAFW